LEFFCKSQGGSENLQVLSRLVRLLLKATGSCLSACLSAPFGPTGVKAEPSKVKSTSPLPLFNAKGPLRRPALLPAACGRSSLSSKAAEPPLLSMHLQTDMIHLLQTDSQAAEPHKPPLLLLTEKRRGRGTSPLSPAPC
jgi:hypothetical protein